MALTAGTRVGHYEIVATLGAGGMGEVYRARDVNLNRDIALKVLPELFAADPERLGRFTREAQTLASLNHPNIAQIHGFEEAAGRGAHVRALAMELVDGDELSALIARGPIPTAEALPIARQIVDALEAAHEHGIVHRDLKPANVKVRPDGTVKVLDFGLAKAFGPDDRSSSDAMRSPTFTAHATQLGVVLGTAAYMSPEQARGKAVDRRADIWAFGAVLFEMLTGKRAFDGDDVSTTLASVLRDEPGWSGLPPDLPAPVARVLRRCLEKDPRRRLSAIGDARLDLEDQEATEPPAGANSRPRWTQALAGAAAGVVVAGLVAYTLWPQATAQPDSGLRRLSILAPPGEQLYPDSTCVAVSPDGSMVAFVVGSVVRSDTELWVRSVGSLTARRLDGATGAILPFWSPDSRRIGFFTADKLKTIAVAGGRPETLWSAPGARGATWNASNDIVFAPDAGGPLYRIRASGGTAEPVTAIDTTRKEYGHRFPSFLPDGIHFLYATLPGKNGRFDIFVGSLSDTTRTYVGALEAAPVYAEPGWLLYARQGVLAAAPFDLQQMKITGEPVMLEDEPAAIMEPLTSFTAGRSVSVSARGALAYYSAPSMNTVARWFDAAGATLGTLPAPQGHYETVSISPDGSRGVLVKSTSPSESSLWLIDLQRGGTSPLSAGAGRNDSPVWSPDGERVVWAGDRNGVQTLYVKNANDASPEQQLFTSDVPFKVPAAWSPDGQRITMNQLDPQSANNIWLLNASGATGPIPLVNGPANEWGGPISPDGRWLAFTADSSGRRELFVQAFPDGGRKVQVSDAGALVAWWSRDGRQLVYASDDLRSLWRVEIASGASLRVGTPKQMAVLPPEIIWLDATPDLKRFLAIAPERTGTGSVTLVENWRSALQR
jgi:serine/threonine protein kinase